MLRTLEISGHRSVRKLRMTLGPITVVQGANGCGKSNLYRVWVTTHAESLAERIRERAGARTKVGRLQKVEGATQIVGARLIEQDPDEEDRNGRRRRR